MWTGLYNTARSIILRGRRPMMKAHHPDVSTIVSDHDIAVLAAKPLFPISLTDLVRHGSGSLAASALFDSANVALSRLPSRLAHRIQVLRNLPFIVVKNPNISQIHNNYVHSLASLLPLARTKIDTLAAEKDLTEVLERLVRRHSNTIPVLARGFLESRNYISPQAVNEFLDEHLRARIGTRIIAEQHIALHHSSQPYCLEKTGSSLSQANSPFIGVIDTALQPARTVRNCESFVAEICELDYGIRPRVLIDGVPETTIAHVPVHLEYIITELLKNAFRASIESGNENNDIQVTIAPMPRKHESANGINNLGHHRSYRSSSEGFDSLHKASPGVTIRIRDQGGGIAPGNYANLWKYGFTTFTELEATNAAPPESAVDALNVISGAGGGGSSLAGLGYGLPLGRAYAEYFGGGIAVQSLWGWGTDVYLTLRGIETVD